MSSSVSRLDPDQAQRKRRPAGSSVVSRTRTKTSRAASGRTRRAAGAGDPAPPTEPIDVMDGAEDGRCGGGGGPHLRGIRVCCGRPDDQQRVCAGPPGESYVLSSDEDEDAPTVVQAAITATAHTSRLTPGLISCPVCLDLYSEIVESGRLVVSTKCGHVFCSQCLRDALTSSHTCPTCRKRLTSRQYHPLYI
ncbi:hypothetical protein CCH79_00005490 [Gambusia affinis]|uniref:RING-type domain-containing protein n=1 Tax=Gambusia affinis TaxID=33528 RepID=A0A315V9F4_GAMAF|nr:hypothetical protein CCH79_00005490 [Gambusia affinis]